jgi:hypothetical protein
MASKKVNYDEIYMALMGRYKDLRKEFPQESLLYLDAAMKIKDKGEVSEEIVFGSGVL